MGSRFVDRRVCFSANRCLLFWNLATPAFSTALMSLVSAEVWLESTKRILSRLLRPHTGSTGLSAQLLLYCVTNGGQRSRSSTSGVGAG